MSEGLVSLDVSVGIFSVLISSVVIYVRAYCNLKFTY